MNRFARTCSIAALAAALLAAGGCIKMKQDLTLMPDGSGKIVFTVGANTPLFKQANPNAETPVDHFNVKEASSNMEGVAAFTGGKKWQKDGWDYTEFTVWFEDINKVVFDKNDPEAPKFTFTNENGTYALTMDNSPMVKMSTDMAQGGGPGDDPAQAAQMKMAFAGFEVAEVYAMPATVTEAPGLKAEGRSASGALTDAVIFDKAKLAEMAKVAKRELKASGDPIGAEAVAAFKADLEKAKQEWAETKKKLEAEAPVPEAPAEKPEN